MFPASVLKVLISTPGDTGPEVSAVEHALHGWNADRAEGSGFILLPRFWKYHSVPMASGSGQTVIDSQLVDDADIVLAIFDTKLGEQTDDAVSGTAHEIDRSARAGNPVHVWFSTEPIPHDVDTSELDRLRKFKDSMRAKALYGEYKNPDDLAQRVRSAIELDLRNLRAAPQSSSTPTATEHAKPVARVVKGPRNDHKLTIENRSSSITAESLTVDFGDLDGYVYQPDEDPFDLIAHGDMSWLLALDNGAPDRATITMKWFENGAPHEQKQTLNVWGN